MAKTAVTKQPTSSPAGNGSTSGNGSRTRSGGRRLDDESLERVELALRAAAAGDFSVRLPGRRRDTLGRLESAYNQLAARNAALEAELIRVARIIGREGRMTERARLHGARGAWRSSIESLNGLIDDLVRPTTEVARVIEAVAEGDLNQKMALEIEGRPVKGEFARIGTTVNSMVDQLSAFADEVTRVAREVGTEGNLGGQAEVAGVSGTWKDLTDSVNFMARNLTEQVRNIADVTTAVANGDLTRKITVDVKGEILELKRTRSTRWSTSCPVVRGRGHPRRQGSGYRRDPRRPGCGPRRRRDVEGPDRQRQLHGAQPHRPGAEHRPGDDRGRPGRPLAEDHGRRAAARCSS